MFVMNYLPSNVDVDLMFLIFIIVSWFSFERLFKQANYLTW